MAGSEKVELKIFGEIRRKIHQNGHISKNLIISIANRSQSNHFKLIQFPFILYGCLKPIQQAISWKVVQVNWIQSTEMCPFGLLTLTSHLKVIDNSYIQRYVFPCLLITLPFSMNHWVEEKTHPSYSLDWATFLHIFFISPQLSWSTFINIFHPPVHLLHDIIHLNMSGMLWFLTPCIPFWQSLSPRAQSETLADHAKGPVGQILAELPPFCFKKVS